MIFSSRILSFRYTKYTVWNIGKFLVNNIVFLAKEILPPCCKKIPQDMKKDPLGSQDDCIYIIMVTLDILLQRHSGHTTTKTQWTYYYKDTVDILLQRHSGHTTTKTHSTSYHRQIFPKMNLHLFEPVTDNTPSPLTRHRNKKKGSKILEKLCKKIC